MGELSDIEERILSKLDRVEDRIGSLCQRVTSLENNLGNHLQTKIDEQASRVTRLTIIISIAAVAVTTAEVLRMFKII